MPTKNIPLTIPSKSERFLFNLESTILSTTKNPPVELKHGLSQVTRSWINERYTQSNPAIKETNKEYCNRDCKEIRRLKEENRILSRVIKNIFP